jgi:hypothetical protein
VAGMHGDQSDANVAHQQSYATHPGRAADAQRT